MINTYYNSVKKVRNKDMIKSINHKILLQRHKLPDQSCILLPHSIKDNIEIYKVMDTPSDSEITAGDLVLCDSSIINSFEYEGSQYVSANINDIIAIVTTEVGDNNAKI